MTDHIARGAPASGDQDFVGESNRARLQRQPEPGESAGTSTLATNIGINFRNPDEGSGAPPENKAPGGMHWIKWKSARAQAARGSRTSLLSGAIHAGETAPGFTYTSITRLDRNSELARLFLPHGNCLLVSSIATRVLVASCRVSIFARARLRPPPYLQRHPHSLRLPLRRRSL